MSLVFACWRLPLFRPRACLAHTTCPLLQAPAPAPAPAPVLALALGPAVGRGEEALMQPGILPTLTPTALAVALLGASSQLEMVALPWLHLCEFSLY